MENGESKMKIGMNLVAFGTADEKHELKTLYGVRIAVRGADGIEHSYIADIPEEFHAKLNEVLLASRDKHMAIEYSIGL